MLLKQRGYFAEGEIDETKFIRPDHLVRKVFQYNIHLKQVVIDSVNAVLAPYEAKLQREAPLIPIPPFRKYKNLYTLHIRHGKGEADFQDSMAFLRPNSTSLIMECILERLKEDDLIFVASDSTKTKEIIRKHFGDRVITLNSTLKHSSLEEMEQFSKKDQRLPIVNALTDMMIASMGNRFLGTHTSTLSTMAVMLGKPKEKYIGRIRDECFVSHLYLPY